MNHTHPSLVRGLFAIALLVLVHASASGGTLYLARMIGANENPPNTSTFTGTGVLILNDAETQAIVTATHDINIPLTGGHIHRGTAAVNGPVILPFAAPASPVGPITWAIPATEIDNLKNLGHYMNFHTATNPGGVIRGTLVRALLAPAAMTPGQTRLANALDISAGYDADLDQILIQTNLASSAMQSQTLAELTANTVYAPAHQQIETMAGLADGVFAQLEEMRSRPTEGTRNGFVRGGHGFGRRDASDNQAGSTISRPFAVAGMDFQIGPGTRGGLAIGYASGRDSFKDGAGKATTKTTALQGFVSFELGETGVAVDGTVGYGMSSIDSTRNLPGLARVATASPDGKVWSAALKASKTVTVAGGATLAPYALLDLQKATVDAYTEGGAGAAGLVVPERELWNSAIETGASLLLPVKVPSGALSARLQAGWRHVMEDGSGSISTWLAGSPVGFRTDLDGTPRDSAHIEAALNATLAKNKLATLGYRGLLGGGGQTLHAIEARFIVNF